MEFAETVAWIAAGCTLLGVGAVAHLRPWGWLFKLLGSLAWLVYGTVVNVFPLQAEAVIFMALNLYGLRQWEVNGWREFFSRLSIKGVETHDLEPSPYDDIMGFMTELAQQPCELGGGSDGCPDCNPCYAASLMEDF